MVMQNPSAKVAVTTGGRIGKEVKKEHEKQITATIISDRRIYKKQESLHIHINY